MKTLPVLAFVAALLTCAGLAQAADDDFQAKYEEKIAKPFVAHGSWGVDYDKALERAKAEGKPIFAYFTRSYAT